MMVLDTNILSELRLPSPNSAVAEWFARVPTDEIAIASFSATEVELGIAALPARRRDFAARLAQWLDVILATHRILPLDGAAARLLGPDARDPPALRHLAVTYPDVRQPRFGGDLIIASTCQRRLGRDAQSG